MFFYSLFFFSYLIECFLSRVHWCSVSLLLTFRPLVIFVPVKRFGKKTLSYAQVCLSYSYVYKDPLFLDYSDLFFVKLNFRLRVAKKFVLILKESSRRKKVKFIRPPWLRYSSYFFNNFYRVLNPSMFYFFKFRSYVFSFDRFVYFFCWFVVLFLIGFVLMYFFFYYVILLFFLNTSLNMSLLFWF